MFYFFAHSSTSSTNSLELNHFRPYIITTYVFEHFKKRRRHRRNNPPPPPGIAYTNCVRKRFANATWPFCPQLLLRFLTVQAFFSALPPPSQQMHESWDPANKHVEWAPSHLVSKNCGDTLQAESQQLLPRNAVKHSTNMFSKF